MNRYQQGFTPPEENKFYKFPVITSNSKANLILDNIFESDVAVVGIDTEAAVEMSRFGVLCLIQVIYNII